MATQAEDKTTSNESNLAIAETELDGGDNTAPAKKQKLDTEDTASGKKSSGSRKKRSDVDMIAEAKAFYGELDTSAGRSLRRRSEPKPVEEKKKPTPKRNSKKKDAEKTIEKEVESKDNPEENNGKEEEDQKQDDKNAEKDEDKPQSTDKKAENANETSGDQDKHKEEDKSD